MQSVYLVQHRHTLPGGEEDMKIIGVYATLEDAKEAANHIRHQPGFRGFPTAINPFKSNLTDGFYIDEYRIGEDHWTEGFGTFQHD